MRNDPFSQSASSDDCSRLSQFFLQPVNDSVHSCRCTVDHTAFHTFCGVLSNNVFRSLQADAAKLGSMGRQRIQRYSDTRINHTANIVFIPVNNTYRIGGTQVKNQQRHRIFGNPRHRVHHQITSQLSRVVNPDIQACLNARSHDQDFLFQYFFYCQLCRPGHLGNHRGNNPSFQLFLPDMVNVQNIFNINGIFQFCLGMDSGKTLHKQTFSLLDTANDNICISDINR